MMIEYLKAQSRKQLIAGFHARSDLREWNGLQEFGLR
jgi:hypothetical protein